jgi:hypothetical protein
LLFDIPEIQKFCLKIQEDILGYHKRMLPPSKKKTDPLQDKTSGETGKFSQHLGDSVE